MRLVRVDPAAESSAHHICLHGCVVKLFNLWLYSTAYILPLLEDPLGWYRGTSDSGLSQIRTWYITNLSTKDMTYGPSIIPTIHFEPPKEDNLSTKSKSAEFMSSPECPLCGGSTVEVLDLPLIDP